MRIAYHTNGDRSNPSSRLRAFLIGDALAAQGHEVAYNPPVAETAGYDVVVVIKRRGALWEKRLRAWRASGATLVWDMCDYYHDPGLAALADVVTVTTPALAALYPGAHVIPDALDLPADVSRKTAHADELKRVVTYCSPENTAHAQHLAAACRRLGLELTVITDTASRFFRPTFDARFVQWDAATVDAEITAHDLAALAFIPSANPAWVNAKSANRLLKAWGLGMPAAATPLPSYRDAGLRHAATTEAEWVGVLERLRGREAREADAEAGGVIAAAFDARVLAQRWLEAFQGRAADPYPDYDAYWSQRARKVGHRFAVTHMQPAQYAAYYDPILDAVAPEAVDTIYDVGCGAGMMVPALRARWPGARYFGFDVSQEMLAHCRQAYPQESWVWLDRAWLPPHGADLILCHSVLTHIDEAEARRWLAVIRDALAPEGRASISVHIGAAEGVRGDIRRMDYAPAYFEAMLAEAGLEVATWIEGALPHGPQRYYSVRRARERG